MKIIYGFFIALFFSVSLYAQVLTGIRANKTVQGTEKVLLNNHSGIPAYWKFRPGHEISPEMLSLYLHKTFHMPAEFNYRLINSEKDNNGEIITRYLLTYNDIPLHDGMFIVHEINGKITAIDGNIPDKVDFLNQKILEGNIAVVKAIDFTNAELYKWQVPAEELRLKNITGNPDASWYPTAELVAFPASYPLFSNQYRIAYKVNVYSLKPLKYADLYIDAQDGTVLFSMDKLVTTDAVGTAVTKYSGTRQITTDSYNGSYRLREADRGLGIETYNMATSTNQASAVDFTDADNYWNNVNAQIDEAATDAHWAAEMTYDFYKQNFNRNSIDNAGLKLISYVHYDVAYDNAFWDGASMNYGDGSSNNPYCALDIGGHEITHGLTQYTANLDYSYESGALNEGFSDVMGTSIEFFAKPTTANWTMGEDIGYVIRNLSNPNAYGLPDTYHGTYWATDPSDNGGVHTNSGVLGYWYYLCCVGGNGTNDIGNNYTVSSMGMIKAQAVVYRTLTHYLVNTSQYTDTRFFSIQSAIDLYGSCSPEVATVTNAWYAVGIGPAYVDSVMSNFNADFTAFCAPPATVTFDNLSVNGTSFQWNFGDGTTSAALNPTHSFNSFGTYNITLFVDGGTCGTATYTLNDYISVDASNNCIAIMGTSGTIGQTGCSGIAYDPGGNGNYPDNISSMLVIQPTGATSIRLEFLSFAYEQDYDYLYIYDGPNAASPLIGQFTGFTLPQGGLIISSGGAITLKHTSDQAVNYSGFEATWTCCGLTYAPSASFTCDNTETCTGIVQFTDQSFCNAQSFLWDFGDGTTSSEQNPVHYYTSDGTYSVRLIAVNANGSDTLVKPAFIHVNLLDNPTVNSAQNCGPGSVTLSAFGSYQITWFDSPTGGTQIGTGNNFITPVLDTTTHYYVEDLSGSVTENTGNPNQGTGGYFNNSSAWGEIFDCYTSLVLNKVKVYALGAAVRNIQLQDSSGNVLQSIDVNIPDGESYVTLNFSLPVANNLLLLGPAYPNLWRDNSGVTYPYQIPGKIKVKYSNVTPVTDAVNYYYYFYDWEFLNPQCSSARVECTAWILNVPVADFNYSVNGSIAQFQDNSQYGIDYLWSFGDGSTSNEQSPVHSYSNIGIYTVNLIISNQCGSDTITHQITISNIHVGELSDISNILIYPNPASNAVYIELNSYRDQNMKMDLFDITGRQLITEEWNALKGKIIHSVDIENLPSGLYMIRISGNSGLKILKFTKE
ncbi:MAG: M4 family metallopeptidase [Bacteroidia bacterium]|nr:M4 family metallopeptidase [Bacteroidia bacterium]